MDPAEISQWKTVLEHHGVTLGRQQQQLEEIGRTVTAISNGLTDLAAQVQQLQVSRAPPAAALLDPVVPRPNPSVSEPRLPPPEHYSGEPGTCRSFLAQCKLIFQLQPSAFPTDQARVEYVITQLSGRAREWGTAVWSARETFCNLFSTFSEEMKKVFDRSKHGREAAREMLHIRQGNRSVSDYAIDFRTLASSSGWNTDAQFDVFLNGLSETIKDEVITQEPPTSFDAVVDLAIRVDSRLQQRRKWRSPRSLGGAPGEGAAPHPAWPALPLTSSTPPEPMQINRYHLTATEKQRRLNGNLCLYCGQSGHFSVSCPSKGGAHQ